MSGIKFEITIPQESLNIAVAEALKQREATTKQEEETKGLTFKYVCSELKMTKRTLYNKRLDGTFKTIGQGKSARITKKSFDAYINKIS